MEKCLIDRLWNGGKRIRRLREVNGFGGINEDVFLISLEYKLRQLHYQPFIEIVHTGFRNGTGELHGFASKYGRKMCISLNWRFVCWLVSLNLFKTFES